MLNIRGGNRTSLEVVFCLSILALTVIACGTESGAPTKPEDGDTGGPDIPTGLAEWEAEHVVPDPSSQSLVVSNHLVVRVSGSATPSEVMELADEIDGEVVGSFAPSEGDPAVYQFEISDPSLNAIEDAATRLRQEPKVLVSVPRVLHPPSGHLDNDGRAPEDVWAYHRVNLSEAWHLLERQNVSRSPVSVGILDTGLDDNHPEFANTTIKGVNLLSNAQDQDWQDRIGHGTQVAGVVAAENNNQSFNGVLGPDTDGYTLIVYRVAGRLPEDLVIDLPDWVRKWFCPDDVDEAKPGECRYSDNAAVVAATSCARTGQAEAEPSCPQADIINYSFANGPALMKELGNTPEDFILVAGAGNDGEPIRLSEDLDSRFYLVGGTNRDSGRWSTGTSGSDFGDITLAAPGEEILTTQLDGDETVVRGTSVAAPFVSGAVALLWQLGEPVADIKATLRRTAQSIDVDTPDGKETWLRVDICRAVADVLGLTDPSKQIIAESGEDRNQPPSDLYFVEPFECGTDSLAAEIRTPAGKTPVITDLALDADSSLWGASFEKLYRINLEDGTAREVGQFGVEGVNSLDFAPDGTLFGATQNVSIFGSPEPGSLLRIDPATAETIEIGEFGPDLETAGDLAFADDGTLFAALRNYSTGENMLATIDTATGTASLVDRDASLGFSGVFGLRFVDGSLFGLTADGDGSGELIVIDTETGVGDSIRTLSFGAFGAASRKP